MVSQQEERNSRDARRGYVPEDVLNFSEESLAVLRKASRDVGYLINGGYDLKQATTFVGNHYLLSERQRLAVMRSLATTEQLEEREKKLIPLAELEGRDVWIDGFNSVITLEIMLNDSILLDCMDGTVRDLAGLRGTYRIIPETAQAIRIILGTLQNARAGSAVILLDEPVSNSGRLKSLIAEISGEFSLRPDIRTEKDVDRQLYGKENVVTSDSIILDRCESWVNLVAEYMRSLGKTGIRVW